MEVGRTFGNSLQNGSQVKEVKVKVRFCEL